MRREDIPLVEIGLDAYFNQWNVSFISCEASFIRFTVEAPISGHPKRRTALISGQIFFPRPFSGQILIKNVLKGGHSISGRSD